MRQKRARAEPRKRGEYDVPSDSPEGRILAILREKALKAAAVSKRARLGESYIRDHLRRPGMAMQTVELERLAEALGVTPEFIAYGAARAPDRRQPGLAEARARVDFAGHPAYVPFVSDNAHAESLPELRPAPRLAPEHLGKTGRLEVRNLLIDENERRPAPDPERREVDRPPALADSDDAYAVIVADRTMEPAHKVGDLRYVAPEYPIASGDLIVLIQRDKAGRLFGVLKELDTVTPNWTVVRQLDPPKLMKIFKDRVVAAHRALTPEEAAKR
jgi:lambda repressor-like predicted transcriptional regulator